MEREQRRVWLLVGGIAGPFIVITVLLPCVLGVISWFAVNGDRLALDRALKRTTPVATTGVVI